VSTKPYHAIARWIACDLRLPRRAVLPALMLLLLACAREQKNEAAPSPPIENGSTVATIGGDPVPYASFERYLADNAGNDAGEGEQEDTIKSRLLDQFLEERLLLRAAGGLKISVSDAEIDAYLRDIGVGEGEAEAAGAEGKEAFREKVRQSLIYQKVKDEAVLSKVQVTAGEVEDHFRKQADQYRSPRAVVLRQILIDDRSLADRLRSTLASDPSRFEEQAREHSVAPDRGQARMYAEEELPVELRGPLFALQPGEISPVLENAQRFLIFQLVRKIEAQEQNLADVKRRVQVEIFQKKGEQALERFIADLKKETEIRVNRATLPFDYSGEYRN
jgi:parvulin-like peptidyl-prolyl isomerase